MKKKIIYILLLLVSITGFSIAQENKFSANTFINNNGDTLKYRFLFPDYSKDIKYPLVIFLHGSGERGSDNSAQLKWGVMNFASDQNMALHPCFVIAPQCPMNDSWEGGDYDQKTFQFAYRENPTKSMQLLKQLIDEIIKKFQVDQSRIYITGLSMGGIGTFDAMIRYPDLFAAALPVCGGGDIEKIKSAYKLPVWIIHGAKDAALDQRLSLNMYTSLLETGGHPGLSIYPEVGHFVWLQAYSDPLIMQWLFNQHK
jgi:predicted peptidase